VHRTEECQEGEKYLLFKKSFGIIVWRNPRNARSAWEIEIFKEIKLRRDNTSNEWVIDLSQFIKLRQDSVFKCTSETQRTGS
jgi:hypothetical protein